MAEAGYAHTPPGFEAKQAAVFVRLADSLHHLRDAAGFRRIVLAADWRSLPTGTRDDP
ncbi:MAG: hypothetical protein H7317_17505 [Pseudorhodobacter sp.]|nr:hypothetical protein [Pseudorhodobacter sp.]